MNAREKAKKPVVVPKEFVEDEFKNTYGLDPGTAAVLFQANSHLKDMLNHLYLETMEELRECGADEFVGIQAQARLLWTLCCIPEEVKKIQEME